jgi:pyrimidine oxygenase
MRQLELGIFMPIASNGFIFSKRAPHYEPTFDLHRQIALLAEEIGFDYVFWMGKWKGLGGATRHWEAALEPVTLASAIAACTRRLRLFATINPLAFHPTVAAKMVATIDDVSSGRLGINIVTGNTLDEYEQMGIVPDGYNRYRYAYAEEWTTVLKELWSKDKVTFHGRFFHLVDCVSNPKPKQKPYPVIVSAASSEEGRRFGARHSDYAFMGVRPEEIAETRQFARELSRSIKVVSNIFLLPRGTDAQAQGELALLREELDHDALNNLIAATEREMRGASRADWLRAPGVVGFGSGTPVVGSPETIARKLATLVIESQLDAIQFTFLDFIKDLETFQHRIAPILKDLLGKEGIAVNLLDSRANAS